MRRIGRLGFGLDPSFYRHAGQIRSVDVVVWRKVLRTALIIMSSHTAGFGLPVNYGYASAVWMTIGDWVFHKGQGSMVWVTAIVQLVGVVCEVVMCEGESSGVRL